MNRKLTLKDLGAENCINLLQPVRCECGCGGYGNIIIKDEEDYNVFTVAGSLLADTDCCHAWIFVIEDWAISGAYTTEDEEGEQIIQYFTTAVDENDHIIDFEHQVEFARAMIEDIEPHCIGVLQHTGDGTFRVVMEDIYENKRVFKVKAKKKKRNPYLN